jgi:succinoglycan biosynthesis protein ExoA
MNPEITIILPTLNEEKFIEDCLNGLLEQDYPTVVEILVVDGRSTDRTREIVESYGPPVRLLDNPRVTAAAAMNVGIEHCQTELFVRVDAHSTYATNYVSQSVKTSLETGASVVGGPMRPQGTTPFGEAVAAVTSSPLGVGPGKFHYATELQEVDTVYLGIFRREEVLQVGGYDEENLQWAAEDQELNYRIRKNGGRIVLDPEIQSTYFPRSSAKALAKQYYNYGLCKASTLKKHKTLPYWRPLAPTVLVLVTLMSIIGSALLSGLLTTLLLLVVIVGIYGLVGFFLASKRLNDPRVIDVGTALAICHFSYGLGLWKGIIKILFRRDFEKKPNLTAR